MNQNNNIYNDSHQTYQSKQCNASNNIPTEYPKSKYDSERSNKQSFKKKKMLNSNLKNLETKAMVIDKGIEMCENLPLGEYNLIINQFDGLKPKNEMYVNNSSDDYFKNNNNSKILQNNFRKNETLSKKGLRMNGENELINNCNYILNSNEETLNVTDIMPIENMEKILPRWTSEEELYAFDKESSFSPKAKNVKHLNQLQEAGTQHFYEPVKELSLIQRKSNSTEDIEISRISKKSEKYLQSTKCGSEYLENGVGELMKNFPLNFCDKIVSSSGKDDYLRIQENSKSTISNLFGSESDNSLSDASDSIHYNVAESKNERSKTYLRKKRRKRLNELFVLKKFRMEDELESQIKSNKHDFVHNTESDEVNNLKCPQSPLFFKHFDPQPRTIPLTRTVQSKTNKFIDNMINEATNVTFSVIRNPKADLLTIDLLETYIHTSCFPKDVDEIVNKTREFLKNQPRSLFMSIVEILKKTDECLDDQEEHANSPRLPPAIKKILLYLKAAGGSTLHLIFRYIEEYLFSTDSHKNELLICMNLTHLYIGVLDLNSVVDNKNNARLFLAKCFYFYTDFAYPMIHQIILAFPGVLPCNDDRNYDRSDALISTLQCILMNTYYGNSANPHLKMMKLFNLLTYRYKYESMKPSKVELITNLILKIKAGKTKNVSLCFAMLCRSENSNLSEKNILEAYLLPLITEYYKTLHLTEENDKSIACLLEIISLLIKPIHLTSDISNHLNIFTLFMCASVNRRAIQEAALCAISRLSRFGYRNCYNVIEHFNPCGVELKITTKATLKTFLCMKKVKGT